MRGTRKRMKVTRKVFDSTGNQQAVEEKVVTLHIDPQTAIGSKIPARREGDLHWGKIPADIIFVVRDKPHQIFERSAQNVADIQYTAQITRKQLERGENINVPSIDGSDRLTVELEKLNFIRGLFKINGQGLPKVDGKGERGNLLVKLEIIQDSSKFAYCLYYLLTARFLLQ